MKKYRSLIIMAIVLAFVAVGYFAVVNLIPEVESNTAAAEKLPVIYLTNVKTTEFDHIDWELEDGYKYTLLATNATNSSGNNSRTYTIEGKSQYAFDRNTIGSALVSICQISVSSILDENPEDIGVYGLKTPASRVTITPYEGDPVTVLVGDPTPVGSNYYAMVEGKPEVYMIGNTTAKYLISSDHQFRDMVFTNFSDVTKEIRSVYVTENGEPKIGAMLLTEEEIDATSISSVGSRILAPVEHEGNDTIILQEFLPKLQKISAISIIEDGTENAEKYGLTENTVVVEVTKMDGSSKKVTLSQPDASGYRYGIFAGVNSIYLFNSYDFDFIYSDYTRMMYKLVWIHNIENLSRIEMDIKGEKHVMDMEFYIDPNEPVEEGSEPVNHLKAILDGKEISEKNGRRMFQKVISPMIYDMVDETMEIGEIEYSFTVYYADGQKYTLDFARINDRQYAAIRDGKETGFYVNVNDLTAVPNALDQIARGFDISI